MTANFNTCPSRSPSTAFKFSSLQLSFSLLGRSNIINVLRTKPSPNIVIFADLLCEDTVAYTCKEMFPQIIYLDALESCQLYNYTEQAFHHYTYKTPNREVLYLVRIHKTTKFLPLFISLEQWRNQTIIPLNLENLKRNQCIKSMYSKLMFIQLTTRRFNESNRYTWINFYCSTTTMIRICQRDIGANWKSS